MLELIIRHHNKSYGYENNNKSRQKTKSLVEQRKKVSKSIKPKKFRSKLIYYPVNAFPKPLRTTNVMIM